MTSSADEKNLVVRYLDSGDLEALGHLRARPAHAFDYIAEMLAESTLPVPLDRDQREYFVALVGLAADLADRIPDHAVRKLASIRDSAEFAAAEVLATMADRRAQPILASLLRSPEETVRWAAVQGLAGRPGTDVTSDIHRMLDDRSRLVRTAAVESLFRRGDPASAAELRSRAARWRQSDQAIARRALEVADLLERGRGGSTSDLA